MIEGSPQGAPKPIIDLRPLLELPEWFHAVQMFRDQGTTMPMAQLLQPLADTLNDEIEQLFRSGDTEAGRRLAAQARPVGNSVDWLQRYAFAYESALPLELGKASKGLIDSIQEPITVGSVRLPPLFAELTEGITVAAENAAFEEFPNRGGNWKENICLNEDELERQACIIDIYLARNQLSLAIGLMREWVVSWAIWKSENSADIQIWLNREVRERYTRRIGAIGAFARTPAFRNTITPEQRNFGAFWDQLGNALRNVLHHHAMRVEVFEEPPDFLEDVRGFWIGLRQDGTELPPLGGSQGKLLISPQGTRPGVLFSALKVTHPANSCMVVCSSTSVSSIDEAAEHADFEGCVDPIELKDPHGGFDEITEAVNQARHRLLEADEIVANMTGGTTLMGIIVQQLVEEAQKLDRPVRRFILIDRRSPEDQELKPFVQSDCHWLDN